MIKIENGKIFRYKEVEEISIEQVEQEVANTRDRLVNDIEQAKVRQEADQQIIDAAQKGLKELDDTEKAIKKIPFVKGEVSLNADTGADLEANEKGK